MGLPIAANQPLLSDTLSLFSNVANLFTVQGDADPLALLPLLVGVWQ